MRTHGQRITAYAAIGAALIVGTALLASVKVAHGLEIDGETHIRKNADGSTTIYSRHEMYRRLDNGIRYVNPDDTIGARCGGQFEDLNPLNRSEPRCFGLTFPR